MRTVLRYFMASVAVVLAVSGCSSGEGDDAAKGRRVEETCGAFAKSPPASTAFKSIAGTENVDEDRSEPDRVLKDLRAAALKPQSGKTLMEAIPFCSPKSARDGKDVFLLTFREALALPGRDAASEKVATFFASGELASASDLRASVYFTCRMKSPAHDILIAAELERAEENQVPQRDIRSDQVTVVNAAARKVAADLGCQNDTKLVTGTPRPAA
ncbi:hypothetical protein [Streptomyces sp. NPDC006368]|uniref:hypothetical protein n=1 Tax=Streptomyces sp. NPDC006368 TaxID=3156760 RepID=UPI0033A2EFCA